MATIRKINPEDLDPDVAIGVTLPYAGKDGRIFNSSFTTMEQAKTNMLNLILTRKGERYMQPEFGTDLMKKVFEQSDDELIAAVDEDITSAVETWLPFININELKIQRGLNRENDPNSHFLKVEMKFSLSGDDPTNFESLTFELELEL